MKMNPFALREMLLQIEATPAGEPTYGFKIDRVSNVDIMEHVQLLIDAGLVEGKVVRGEMGKPLRSIVTRMTFAGHQFLANARNNTIWKKVMAQAEEKGMSTSVAVISVLLEAAAKKYVGLE